MNRTIAIVIALLLLASAGWWGATRPDRGGDTGVQDESPAALPGPDAEPATDPAPTTDPAPAEPRPAPAPTPAPVDAALPPETGSELAQQTERAALAAIAAADARARAEATARAERRAREAAEAELRPLLTPLLDGARFSTAAIRAAIASLPPAPDAQAARARARLTDEITAVLDAADAAEAGAGTEARTGTRTEAAPFDPAPYIAQIRRIL